MAHTYSTRHGPEARRRSRRRRFDRIRAAWQLRREARAYRRALARIASQYPPTREERTR